MGSNRREITFLLGIVCCLIIVCKHIITHTNAEPGQLHEERSEFQSIQRSSKIIGSGIGSAGYYNSDSGQYEQQLNAELDQWTKMHRDQVEGMAEKLRAEYNAALTSNDATDQLAASTGNNRYYQTSSRYVSSSSTGSAGTGGAAANKNCNICAVLPSFTGKTQEELDDIAKNMTSQIISDMDSGKLARSQINQPNWFENRVAQTLEELNKQKQISSSASGYQQPIYTYNDASGMHQQSQQQSLYNQGGYYQGQTQSQHSLYYAPSASQRSRYFNTQSSVSQYPVSNQNAYQTTNVENRQRTSEERSRSSVYPPPAPVLINAGSVRTEQNCTSTTSNKHTVATPIIPAIRHQNEYRYSQEIDEEQRQQQEDFGQHPVDFGQTQIDIDRHEYDYSRNVVSATTTPTPRQYDSSYFAQQHNIETERHTEKHLPPIPYQPMPTHPPSSRSQTIDQTRIETTRDQTFVPIVVIPSQQTVISTSSINVSEHEHHHRPALPVYRPIQRPTTNTYHREEESIESERTIHNKPVQPSYVNNIQETTYDRRKEEKVVDVQTPTPTVVTSNSKHSIYGYLDESSEYILPNYRPRVVIDKNSEFHELDQRREPVRTPPQIHSQTSITSNRNENSQTTERNTTQHAAYIPQRPVYNEITRIRTIQTENQNKSSTPTTVIYPQRPSTITTYSETTQNHHSTSRNQVQPLVPTITIHITEELSKYTREEYRNHLRHIQDELARLGYDRLTLQQYNETIASGGFIHNGCQYVYNNDRQRYEKGKRIDVTEQEYNEIYQRLRNQLNENRFGSMNELEINQTITTGVFLRGGYRWMYNTETQRFDQIQIDSDERQQIYQRIREILIRFGYRQLTQRECQLVLYDGSLQRGGYRWLYNYINGMLIKSDYVGELSELTADEYETIYRRIQETLQNLGYNQMSERECNVTITSGIFERGGIQWQYNPDSMTFERITLSQEEYRQRLEILQELLQQLHYQQLSGEEYRNIIYKGYFYNGVHRYEFNSKTRQYDQLELTEQEYRQRVEKLQSQLQRIGYGTMSEAECNATISNGLFHYGGYEWLYNGRLDTYEQGGKSIVDEPGLSEKFDGNNVRDQTQYGSTADDKNVDHNNGVYRRLKPSIISKNRGDQPPQHFEDDYESEENVEQEPGIGFYPTGEKRPEIQLAPPHIFDQVRVVSTPAAQRQPTPTTGYPYYNAPLAPYRNEEERRRYEMQLTHQVQVPAVPAQHADYERQYHRAQSTYTRRTDAQATQQSPLLVLSSRNYQNTNAQLEPRAHPTDSYRVGSEGEMGQQQINNRWGGRVSDTLLNNERSGQSVSQDANVRLAKNASYSMGGSWSQSSNFNKDMETSGTPEEVQRHLDEFSVQNDDPQQLMDINGQYEEDGQKLIEVGQQHEDLTQQQQREDLTQYQQREDLTQHQHQDLRHQQNEDLTQQRRHEDLTQHQQREDFTHQHQENLRHQQREDLTQHRQHEDLTQHQQREDLTQYQQHEDLRQHQQHEDLTQHQQHEDLTQQHEDLTQQRQINVGNEWQRQQDKSGQQIEQIRQTDVTDEKAEVIEITPPVEKPTLWQRIKDKTKNLLG